MSDEIWRPRVTVAAVVADKGRHLLVEEWVDGVAVLNQPAGHLEDDESLIDAVCREVAEETCHHFEPAGLVGVQRWRIPHTADTYLRFCFNGTVSDADPALTRDAEIIAVHWLTMDEILAARDRLRTPLVLMSIRAAETSPGYPLELLQDAPA